MARRNHEGCGGELHAIYIRVNAASGRRTWMRFGTACVRCHAMTPIRDELGVGYGIYDLKRLAELRLGHSPERATADA